MDQRIPSGGTLLAAHVTIPPGRVGAQTFPAVVLCHGYPSGVGGAPVAAETLPELADRLSTEMGWIGVALAFRGCAESGGSFALQGWLDDLHATVDHLVANHPVNGVWLVGFGTGGALAICAGAADPRIRGVVALGAPADFDDWASHPRRLLEHSRDIGLIRDAAFPPSFDLWSRELKQISAVACVQAFSPRPLLVVHGSDDDVVPAFDARVLVDAHGEAELRIVTGASHRLRHDPRVIAILLGWLDRQRHSARAS